MISRRLALGTGFAAFSLALATTTAAQPALLDAVPAGAVVEPGSVLTVSWDSPPWRRDGRDEMELVLSLDGGATYAVRLTERIPSGMLSWTWRVPALPTRNARLALRAGEDEVAASEEILAASAAFAIASTGTEPEEELFL